MPFCNIMEKNIEYYLCPKGHRVFNQSYYRATINYNNGQGPIDEPALTCMVCQSRYSIKRDLRIPDSKER